MNAELLRNLVQTPPARALGWTLFHSLWEGALAATALSGVLFAVRSARARYAAACMAMLAIFAAFICTFAVVMPQQNGDGAAIVRTIPPVPDHNSGAITRTLAGLTASDLLPWVVPFWMAGVILCQLRGLASWTAARRLRRRGVCRAPEVWLERLQQLQMKLGMSKQVDLLESCLVEAPVVIGYLRAAILTPLGTLAGMPTGQIETILMHELAHIRRHDYLVNLLQTAVEGFLFYHPAIWWISGVIGTERENCCDDLAIAASGNAPEYAAALAALEQTRRAASEAALAATGGHLMKRIRRLLYPLERPRAVLTPVVSAGTLTVTAALALLAWQGTPPPQPAQSSWDTWLNVDVVYIITQQEREACKNLQTDEERAQFVEQFWLRRDPTPGTVENEFKEEHYRRIAYANAHFGSQSSVPGWKNDRGRIYITFGPPDEIDAHPSPVSGFPLESWRYNFIEGIGNNVSMEFVDTGRNGEYHMTKDPSEKDAVRYIRP